MQRPGFSSFSIESLMAPSQPRVPPPVYGGYMLVPGATGPCHPLPTHDTRSHDERGRAVVSQVGYVPPPSAAASSTIHDERGDVSRTVVIRTGAFRPVLSSSSKTIASSSLSDLSARVSPSFGHLPEPHQHHSQASGIVASTRPLNSNMTMTNTSALSCTSVHDLPGSPARAHPDVNQPRRSTSSSPGHGTSSAADDIPAASEATLQEASVTSSGKTSKQNNNQCRLISWVNSRFYKQLRRIRDKEYTPPFS